MIEDQDQRRDRLRPLAQDAMRAAAALIPFTAGSGRDGHGDPVPDGEAVVRRGLMTLVEAGRLAQTLLDRPDAMASLPGASAEVSE